ncbi:unnamed protein product [Mytilus coruscus]|uniref:Uncharacterized protein n=1 Tax=Mytilus coruscus TaxID=42192 RepID=A0A6J7ZZC7_MYTCO|nr:unnamed protein product [Mytilus coruscus]
MEDWNEKLIIAAQTGDIKALKLGLQNDADIDYQGYGRETALMCAARRGHPEVTRLLLDSGCNTDITDVSGYTALMWAAWLGHLEVTQLLLDSRCKIDITKSGWTALMFVALKGHLEVTQLLLDSGCNTDITDKAGQTALHLAALNGYLQITRCLVEQGGISPLVKTPEVALFVRTDFIQAQGNNFEKFAKEDFPQLIHIMGILTDETSLKQIITDTTDANNNGKYTKSKTPILTKNQRKETEQVDPKNTDEIQRLETSVTHKIFQMLDNQNSNFQTLKTEKEQVKLLMKCTNTADELDTLLQASKNEVITLNERLNNKKEEINYLHMSNQQLKYTLTKSIDDLNTALQSSRNETHVSMDKLGKKDEEIEKFSTSNRSLSDKLDNLFEHKLNLKSQLLTLLDPQQASQVKTQDMFTLPKADTSHLEQEYTPKVLMIGTSKTKGIKEDKVTNAVKIHKSIQYTIDEATTYITQYEQPNLVILHILTNDLKKT